MSAIEYLIEQLDVTIQSLVEDIAEDNNEITRAYNQGKKDAYGYVLAALSEGLKAEGEEVRAEIRRMVKERAKDE